MKNKLLLIVFLVLVTFQSNILLSQDYTQTKETQSKLTTQTAIQMLKDGNKRFLDNTELHRDFLAQVHKTADGQYPFAFILSCIDSRTSSEIIFDQGIGDIFNGRVAGNIIDEDILGGMEYSCKVVGAKVILVIGHTHCGAIKGACDDVKLGNLTALISKIKGPVQSVKTEKGEERTSNNHEFVEHVSKANVLNSIAEIKSKSSILKEMSDKGEIIIVGAMYDVDTGEVTFY